MANNKIITLALALVLAASFVSAFAISAFYWEPDRPLSMKPGETKDVYLLLQNMVGGSDMDIRAEMISGNEIAVITDASTDYSVPFGRKDVPINIRVSIPETDEVGKEYVITVSVRNLEKAEGGMLQLGTAVESTIPVVVSSSESAPMEPAPTQPEKTSFVPFLIAIAVLAVIILVAVLARRKKKK